MTKDEAITAMTQEIKRVSRALCPELESETRYTQTFLDLQWCYVLINPSEIEDVSRHNAFITTPNPLNRYHNFA